MIVRMNNLAQSPKKTCPNNRLAKPIVNTNAVYLTYHQKIICITAQASKTQDYPGIN